MLKNKQGRTSLRNLEVRNFGLKSRDMTMAGKNAMREAGDSYKSIDVKSNHFKQFVNHIREAGVKDLRQVEKSHVRSFAAELAERYERGQIAASTAQNMLSAVNSTMAYARQDDKCTVHAVRDAGLPSRSHIATESKSVSIDVHQNAQLQISERLAVQLDLQRELGLRMKESCLIDSRSVLNQAEKSGVIQITAGTKGGRPRSIPITSEKQISALRNAAVLQQKDRSMVPTEQSLKSYINSCYKQLEATTMRGFHGERHHYANSRYEQLTGVKSPVEARVKHGSAHINYIAQKRNITTEQAKLLDLNARARIAEELGHSRVSITNNYLG